MGFEAKRGVGDGLQCYTAMTTRAPAVQRKAALQRRLGNTVFKFFRGNLVFLQLRDADMMVRKRNNK